MASVIDTRTIEVRPRPSRNDPSPPRSTVPEDWTSFFEQVYARAGGDTGAVPWADGKAHPALVAWLNAEAPNMLRPGASVIVAGCGLGDDVQELSERGYDAIGFDCSPTAIGWARRRHAAIADRLLVADLFQLPQHMLRRHDLVVEINTVQALTPAMQPQACRGIVSLSRPRGVVLTICRARDEGEPPAATPPFAPTPRELESMMAAEGLSPVRAFDIYTDDEAPPCQRMRAMFRRP